MKSDIHHSSLITHHLRLGVAVAAAGGVAGGSGLGRARRPAVGRRAGRHRPGGEPGLRGHEEQPLLLRPLPDQGREGNVHLHQPPLPCREAVERQHLRVSAGDHDRRGRLPVVGGRAREPAALRRAGRVPAGLGRLLVDGMGPRVPPRDGHDLSQAPAASRST